LTTTDIPTKLSASILKRTSVPEYKINEEYIKEKEKYDDVQTLRQNQIGIIFQDEAGTTEEIGTQETEVEDEFQELSAKSEKLLWHYRLGLAPFSAINWLAESGELPKRLAKASDPKCSSCMYGQSTRRAWRTKAETNQIGERSTITRPGTAYPAIRWTPLYLD
jgi:hypothetical protein